MPKRAMESLTESMFYVLMALQQEPMCGIDIAAFIEQRTNGRIRSGPATLYTILGKFEKERLIREIQVDGRKRTYRITDKGEESFANEIARLRQCLSDAAHIGKGGERTEG
jgi:DNA-binding PadR family transcriptional regulator